MILFVDAVTAKTLGQIIKIFLLCDFIADYPLRIHRDKFCGTTLSIKLLRDTNQSREGI